MSLTLPHLIDCTVFFFRNDYWYPVEYSLGRTDLDYEKTGSFLFQRYSKKGGGGFLSSKQLITKLHTSLLSKVLFSFQLKVGFM